MQESKDGLPMAGGRERLHLLVAEHEARWGIPGECVDENGELRRYATPDHCGPIIEMRSRQFPAFPDSIADPEEGAAMNSFAEEALEAIDGEPLSMLHHHDLSAWLDHGANEEFVDRVRREELRRCAAPTAQQSTSSPPSPRKGSSHGM